MHNSAAPASTPPPAAADAEPRKGSLLTVEPLSPGLRAKAEASCQAIYRALRAQIVEGRLPSGSRLPTERALAERFGAARNTVRKTMTRLVEEGLVERHVGRGTFVADARAAAARPADPRPGAQPPGLAELLEARMLFEPALAELVAERATEPDLEALRGDLAALAAAESWTDFKEAKYALHLAIVRCSKNRFMTDVFQRILDARRDASWDRPGGPSPARLTDQGDRTGRERGDRRRAGAARRADGTTTDSRLPAAHAADRHRQLTASPMRSHAESCASRRGRGITPPSGSVPAP